MQSKASQAPNAIWFPAAQVASNYVLLQKVRLPARVSTSIMARRSFLKNLLYVFDSGERKRTE